MRRFNIRHTADSRMEAAADKKINDLAKPKGSLGRLEEIAKQICMIQRTLTPVILKPANILFSADHGIADEGVSFSPKEVTWQQTANFFHGGAGINFLCRQNGFRLMVVDSGIDADLSYLPELIDMKVRRGTRNFRYEAAMTREEMELCIERGAKCVDMAHGEGTNIVSFGEMGIGNTSASSMWMTAFTGIPLEKCVGAGSGLGSKGIEHKLNVLKDAMANWPGEHSAEEIICHYGGYEMVMAVGGMLRAAELGMVILVDGFIMTSCILAASRLYPEVLDYAIFGHQGNESGHILMLDYLKAKALLQLELRLGEGSGSVCSYPIVLSAVNMINQMDTFSGSSVTKYF